MQNVLIVHLKRYQDPGFSAELKEESFRVFRFVEDVVRTLEEEGFVRDGATDVVGDWIRRSDECEVEVSLHEVK